MKYMHFKSSCAYTAIASMMESRGIDTEDDRIALEMKLPFLFAKEGDAYLSGPQLQSAEWLNLWLLPRGFQMEEEAMSSMEAGRYLQGCQDAMLGIITPFGKHAVVYQGYEDGVYRFMNPSYEDNAAETSLALDEASLLGRLEGRVVVATLHAAAPQPVDLKPYMQRSIPVLQENVAEIVSFSSKSHTQREYSAALNRIFRPLLLDGISMLELLGEAELAGKFQTYQNAVMQFIGSNRKGLLKDVLPLPQFRKTADQYAALIKKAIG